MELRRPERRLPCVLPPAGSHRYFATCEKVPWRKLGIDKDDGSFMALASTPMGWSYAVALFQYLHRRIGFGAKPLANSPACPGWRRDGPLPLHPYSQVRMWAQLYLDDFDAPEAPRLTAMATMPEPESLSQSQCRGARLLGRTRI